MLQCCFMCCFKFGADLVDVVTCFSHLHKHFTFLPFAISARSIIILFQIFIWTGTAQCCNHSKVHFFCKQILSVHPSTKTRAYAINVLFSDIRTRPSNYIYRCIYMLTICQWCNFCSAGIWYRLLLAAHVHLWLLLWVLFLQVNVTDWPVPLPDNGGSEWIK